MLRFAVFLFFLIDPILLLGKWDLKFAEANFNMINSSAFQATPKEKQDEILEINELYLKNAVIEFRKDTVYWVDVNPREKVLVHKKGKWVVIGDTLKIFDYYKIFTYTYLVKINESNELEKRMVFPDGIIARSKDIYTRSESEN